jgi:3-hydroxybutyryl-CoA dehydrogenase
MKVAVIGTGTLGPSIAQVFSQCEKVEKVFLCKGRASSKSNGKEKIENAFDRLIAKEKINSEQADEWLAKIEAGEKELTAGADLLVEAVSEDIDVKKAIFRDLDNICGSETIFATNTSSLPIQTIGKGLSRPLIGMHFFNPAPVMKLVEVIATERTPQSMVDYVMSVARDIGKTPVEVREAPGFVVNRVLIPMINEAISIYAEGVASVEDIDMAMKLGANHPMGPLALGDLIGLDVVLDILNVMLKETGDNRYLAQPMLKKMVREKKLGRKTGEGFYKY